MDGIFDGPAGSLAGAIMARANAAAEAEAVERLDPRPNARVLVLGFGPGVGVQRLVERLIGGSVLGVDPSAAMLKAARSRNRRAVADGRVRLERARADAVPAADASFDGAIAVNTLQMCEPFAATARELARVMGPGARLVSITHDWAILRHALTVEAWTAGRIAALDAAGFKDGCWNQAKAENGRAIALTATRA